MTWIIGLLALCCPLSAGVIGWLTYRLGRRQARVQETGSLIQLDEFIQRQVPGLISRIGELETAQQRVALEREAAIAERDAQHKRDLATLQLEHDREITRQAREHERQMEARQNEVVEMRAQIALLSARIAELENKIGTVQGGVP